MINATVSVMVRSSVLARQIISHYMDHMKMLCVDCTDI